MTAYILCSAMMAAGFGTNVDIACHYAQEVIEASEEYRVDPLVLAALIQVESHWNPRARSSAGACGLTQILPRFTVPRVSCRTLLRHPDIAIVHGARALRQWLQRGENITNPDRRLRIALCAYNAGNRCFRRPAWNSAGMPYARRVLRLSATVRRHSETIRTLDTNPAPHNFREDSLEELYLQGVEGCGL